ncbi:MULTISPECIES: hypothetical protein [Dactylosporangium]|uniref:Uncharacterized protein n=2 Tax=Dactylosporangium TaxID=35753 RepID=A0A9W6NR41_9ACTN|nr:MULTISPECIES: hypothetical protein [Dactylosporangium]UAB95388.1 hypothetical protein Dvina_46445 [Dactylosporangium vinaceum]UWZ43708.1 hypothetical protein Dmats_40790 [Dactylosporangium matsuzakiense]GLL05802.1 hypothetical protein GCM10017581_075490 [Dactylosporangium matsuzakiense]
MAFPDVQAADHHILMEGRPAFTYFAGGQVSVGTDAQPPPEGARQVLFAGSEALKGTIAVAAILDSSAIERVVILGGLTAVPEMLVDTRDHVRPIWRDGVLTLVTQFGRGGVLVPFEPPNNRPCCSDH